MRELLLDLSSGFRCFGMLGCVGRSLPTFRDNVSVPYSRLKQFVDGLSECNLLKVCFIPWIVDNDGFFICGIPWCSYFAQNSNVLNTTKATL